MAITRSRRWRALRKRQVLTETRRCWRARMRWRMGLRLGAMENIHWRCCWQRRPLLAALRQQLRLKWTLPDMGAQCSKALLPDCGGPVRTRANDFSGTDDHPLAYSSNRTGLSVLWLIQRQQKFHLEFQCDFRSVC